MRLASFTHNGATDFGRVVDDGVVPLGRTTGASDLRAYLAAAEPGDLPPAGESGRLPFDAVDLLPPIPDAAKILCVATNFRDASRDGKPDPHYPQVFTRFADSFVGHGKPLLAPAPGDFDFEGELAVVIGRRCHKVDRSQALGYVVGYCCVNDGSVRDWQKHSTQFTPGKNFPASGAMGPWLVTPDEIGDLGRLALTTSVNGVVEQQIGLDRMIFDVAWLIAYMSSFTPLGPGDIISTGTPTGFRSSKSPKDFLRDGDRIDVVIDGIGHLSNTVRTEPRPAAG